MAPREKSWLDIKYPTYRNTPILKLHLWIKGKQKDDGAENLWRIHDGLYDLSSFISEHPGGSMWLNLTKGTDITEAFESHHINRVAEKKLPQFYVRNAETPRNSPFTFHPDGFYKTLKQKVQKYFNYACPPPSRMSTILLDFYFHGGLFLAVLAAQIQSILLTLLAGLLFGFVVTCGHNFLHMKDTWRIYYYPCVSFSIKEWRIHHCLSHHLYPNTLKDLEISMFEPFLQFLPDKNKSIISRFGSWLLFPFVCMLTSLYSITVRFAYKVHEREDILILLPPIMMLLFGNFRFYTLFLWFLMVITTGVVFTAVGLTAAHHDHETFHEGDKARMDHDWGLLQYDAAYDRNEILGNRFFGLIMFGEHALHHLFPTIDFCHLQDLIPIYNETLKEFGLDPINKPIVSTILGTFIQLARNEPRKTIKESKRIN